LCHATSSSGCCSIGLAPASLRHRLCRRSDIGFVQQGCGRSGKVPGGPLRWQDLQVCRATGRVGEKGSHHLESMHQES
jgi:hypothetical protein